MQINDHIKNKTLDIIVKPNSNKTEIISYDKQKDALKINIKSPPEKGKANTEIIKFLSKTLKNKVKIIKGLRSHKKTIKII